MSALLGVFRALQIVLRLSLATGMATGGSRRLMSDRGSPLMQSWRFRGTLRRPIYNWILKVFTNLRQFCTCSAYVAEGPYAAVVKVLLDRDPRSVHSLVPDSRVIDWGIHDVTIIDSDLKARVLL